MKTNFKKYVAAIGAAASAALVPAIAFAQNNQVSSGLSQLQVGAGFGSFIGITSSTTLGQLIANIIRLLLFFSGMIAVVFVVLGGYRYLTAGGNEESATKGKNTVVHALIGVVIIILSYVIVNVIVNTVSQSSGFIF